MKKIYTLLFLITFFNLSAQVPSYVSTDGLVGWWSFNGNANDESGNGNDGVVNGPVLTTDKLGNQNSAYEFDVNATASWGSDQQSIIISNPTIPTNNSFTMSSWVYLKTKPAPYNDRPHSIMGRWDGNAPPVFRFQLSQSANYYGGETFVQSSLPQIVSCPLINFNEWHHHLISYDGSVFKQYVDGVMINEYTINIQLPYSNSNLTFGKTHMTNGNWLFFNGIMDELGYWSRALSESEIKAIYSENVCTDTIQVMVYDTTYITINDTITFNDTNYVSINDTITYYDSVSVAVTDTLIINAEISGLNSPNNINTLKVYPNPANDIVIIDNGDFNLISTYTLKILNSLGAEVFNSFVSIPQFQIPVSSLGNSGLYYIQIFDENNILISTKKLIMK